MKYTITVVAGLHGTIDTAHAPTISGARSAAYRMAMRVRPAGETALPVWQAAWPWDDESAIGSYVAAEGYHATVRLTRDVAHDEPEELVC